MGLNPLWQKKTALSRAPFRVFRGLVVLHLLSVEMLNRLAHVVASSLLGPRFLFGEKPVRACSAVHAETRRSLRNQSGATEMGDLAESEIGKAHCLVLQVEPVIGARESRS